MKKLIKKLKLFFNGAFCGKCGHHSSFHLHFVEYAGKVPCNYYEKQWINNNGLKRIKITGCEKRCYLTASEVIANYG